MDQQADQQEVKERTIFEVTVDHFLTPIKEYMDDPAVAEIMINAWDEIYVEKKGKLTLTGAKFADSSAMLAAVNNVLQYTGKRMDPMHPLIDSRLPDGSRVHVVLAPLCRAGTTMTIRKFAKKMFDADNLTKIGTWTEEAKEYIELMVRAEKNILVAGGTSSGKTSLLNVLSTFVPNHQRIVTIEDSAELELQQDHVVILEARMPDRWGRGGVNISELFRSSLRLRPDRVIIGEVRGGEAMDMIQAMTSGHAGSMSTLHANTALSTLNRLETLAMMNPIDLPLHALRSQIASAIDMIVLVTRFNDGRRCLTEIAEVLPLDDNGQYQTHPMFEYKLVGEEGKKGIGTLQWSGIKSIFTDEPKIRVLRDSWNLTKGIFQADTKKDEGSY
ncbi:MAG: CpaF family protein [Phycisphaerales bacterium]|jgi:pilus assembly protein CpaF|nr:CpaF family protein [Phycisphaerales bacterium]